MTRDRLLRETCELVVRTMNLRPPQMEALRELRDALLRLPRPLKDCTPDERKEFLAVREGWVHPFHPTFTLALATGVGKTRLAGGMIAFLWLTGEARTFLILAPRRAVQRRFESSLDPRFREYLFVDPNLVPEPSVVRADEIDGPRAFEFEGDLVARGPKIYLLSPQLITSSERFKRPATFTGTSPAEAITARRDLVAIVDEAHHVGRLSSNDTTAWALAIRSLGPCLQIGLTATPRGEEGEHVLYEYPLRRALREGRYTKDVHLCVRSFDSSGLADEDIDRAAIGYSLDRLERKRSAMNTVPEGFPIVKPVCVFFARDIAHATEVKDYLLATERVSESEVLLTHSRLSKSEEDLEALLSIEDPRNPVRIVVNVMELTEGWDVTNVYVVTPLRAMATFQGALQAMGRGLRLPAGRRTGQPVLDELDVVCFGRHKLERIVTEATQWTGTASAAGGGVKITEFDKSDPTTVPIEIPDTLDTSFPCANLRIAQREIALSLSPDALRTVSEAVVTEVDLVAARTRLGFGRPMIPRDRFVRVAALRCIRSLPEFLSDAQHLGAIENIVAEWINSVRPGDASVEFDPTEVGEEIAAALRHSAKLLEPEYVGNARSLVVTFPAHTGWQEVMLAPGAQPPLIELSNLPIYQPTGDFVVRRLYRGWSKAGHAAYAFDSEPEAILAWLLDHAEEVLWWVRNVPCRLEIGTPAGAFRPDFVARVSTAQASEILILEAKADHRWEEPTSEARIKQAAAKEWAERQRELGYPVRVALALESDIRRSGSWSELRPRLQ
jgi:superfamily II DNA or RNA helicase